MADYATTTDLAIYIGSALSTAYAASAPLALTAASRGIDDVTGRDFADAGSVSLRKFDTGLSPVAFVDDFSTTVGLVVALDEDEDGTAETTLTAADYELYPLNARLPGVGACSYSEIKLINRWFCRTQRPSLHVTARWGWSAVPDVIKRATLQLTVEMLKDPATPYGVVGFEGVGAVRLRANPRVLAMVHPFIRTERTVGIG